MATDLDASFSEQFNNINTKLKKRFLRKPNIAEATNEFIALAVQCEHSEQPSFAGHAYAGAAKCESAAGHGLGEAGLLLSAARQFMLAELKLKSLKCMSPGREDLESAISCYLQALNKYTEDSTLRTSILLELANNLILLEHKHEAISYYEQALQTISDKSMVRLKCLCSLMDLHIQTDSYDIALEVANTISDSTINVPENLIIDVHINRILLGLLVDDKLKKTNSLETLFNDLLDDSDELPFNEDLKLILQSILIGVIGRDVDSLVVVSADIHHHFTMQQRDLLMKLIGSLELCSENIV